MERHLCFRLDSAGTRLTSCPERTLVCRGRCGGPSQHTLCPDGAPVAPRSFARNSQLIRGCEAIGILLGDLHSLSIRFTSEQVPHMTTTSTREQSQTFGRWPCRGGNPTSPPGRSPPATPPQSQASPPRAHPLQRNPAPDPSPSAFGAGRGAFSLVAPLADHLGERVAIP